MKTQAGTVFAIPLGEDKWAIGQIVEERLSTLLVVVYEGIYEGIPSFASSMLAERIIVKGLTLDAKLYHGHWPIIGCDKENTASIPRPDYLIGHAEECFVEDFYGKRVRAATSKDISELHYRKVVAPIRIENAVKALLAGAPWDTDYDSLIP